MSEDHHVIIALDYGSRRIGVAIYNDLSRLPKPLKTINVEDNVNSTIKELVRSEQANVVVIGLPRGLNGQTTPQTKIVEGFTDKLRKHLTIPIYLVDEAVTSVEAEAELKQRGQPFVKEDIDSLAAVYILENFLSEQHQVR